MHRQISNPNSFYGWELLYETVRHSILKKTDVIVAFIHFLLTKEFNLMALPKDARSSGRGGERLPDKWNTTGDSYSLEYVGNGRIYQLSGEQEGDLFHINLQTANGSSIRNISVKPDHLVACIKGTLRELFPSAESFVTRLKSELISPVLGSGMRMAESNINLFGSALQKSNSDIHSVSESEMASVDLRQGSPQHRHSVAAVTTASSTLNEEPETSKRESS